MGASRPRRPVRPYLLSRPEHPELVQAWENFWIRYVLDLAAEENLNVVSLLELRRMEPFNRMDERSFRALVDLLLERGYAKWLDRGRGLLRIYWCGPDHWVDKILKAVREAGVISIIEGVEDLVRLVPEMADLPRSEIEDIMELMVKRGLAKWMDRKRKTLRVLVGPAALP